MWTRASSNLFYSHVIIKCRIEAVLWAWRRGSWEFESLRVTYSDLILTDWSNVSPECDLFIHVCLRRAFDIMCLWILPLQSSVWTWAVETKCCFPDSQLADCTDPRLIRRLSEDQMRCKGSRLSCDLISSHTQRSSPLCWWQNVQLDALSFCPQAWDEFKYQNRCTICLLTRLIRNSGETKDQRQCVGPFISRWPSPGLIEPDYILIAGADVRAKCQGFTVLAFQSVTLKDDKINRETLQYN